MWLSSPVMEGSASVQTAGRGPRVGAPPEGSAARAPRPAPTAKGRPGPLQVRAVPFHSHFICPGDRWLFLGALRGLELLLTHMPCRSSVS